MTVLGINDVTGRLKAWLEANQIPVDGLTVILNFRDSDAAARFDWVLNKELEAFAMAWSQAPGQWTVTTNFKMNGLSMKVESPIHPIARVPA